MNNNKKYNLTIQDIDLSPFIDEHRKNQSDEEKLQFAKIIIDDLFSYMIVQIHFNELNNLSYDSISEDVRQASSKIYEKKLEIAKYMLDNFKLS